MQLLATTRFWDGEVVGPDSALLGVKFRPIWTRKVLASMHDNQRRLYTDQQARKFAVRAAHSGAAAATSSGKDAAGPSDGEDDEMKYDDMDAD